VIVYKDAVELYKRYTPDAHPTSTPCHMSVLSVPTPALQHTDETHRILAQHAHKTHYYTDTPFLNTRTSKWAVIRTGAQLTCHHQQTYLPCVTFLHACTRMQIVRFGVPHCPSKHQMPKWPANHFSRKLLMLQRRRDDRMNMTPCMRVVDALHTHDCEVHA